MTFAGVWEIQPAALEEVARKVQIVDVRELEELEVPLGHIPGSIVIPLSQLKTRAHELSLERPVVTVCRSGARSAQGVALLRAAGFEDVANLAGGMLRWRAEGYPVEGGRHANEPHSAGQARLAARSVGVLRDCFGAALNLAPSKGRYRDTWVPRSEDRRRLL